MESEQEPSAFNLEGSNKNISSIWSSLIAPNVEENNLEEIKEEAVWFSSQKK